MKVKALLNKLCMCSTIDEVAFWMKLHPMKSIKKEALLNNDYFGFGDDTVYSFEIHGNKMIIHLKPTF